MIWLAVMTAIMLCIIFVGVLTRTVATNGRNAQEGNMLPRSMAVVFALIFVALIGQTDAARAVGIGRTCAGLAGLGCDDGLWCEIAPGDCKRADAAGRCVRAPQRCGLSYRPVCACGGQTFRSDCVRERARAQKDHDGPCR